MELFPIDTIIKLVTAMILGLALGVERTYSRKTAGMRTYALIAMASAFFAIIGQEVISQYPGFDYDPVRMASQVVVGVGFLGAGIIIFRDARITNLTTASAIWIAAAIGLAIGFGMYIEAIVATLLTLFVLEILASLEHRMKDRIPGQEE